MSTSENAVVLGDAGDAEMLTRSLQKLLIRHWPLTAASRNIADSQALHTVWLALCEFGAARLGAEIANPEFEEFLLAMRALGAAACPAPLLPAVMTTRALARLPATSSAAASLLKDIDCGAVIPALSFGPFDGDRLAGSCRRTPAGVNGRIGLIEDIELSTHLVIALGNGDGMAVVERANPGVSIEAMPGLCVPPLHSVTLTAVPAQYFAVTDEFLSELAWIARLALHSRALGAARRAFDLVLEYAKIRHQFGQPIGRFQAIQHKLADSYLALEASALMLSNASAALQRGDPEQIFHCAAAVAFVGPALRQVSLETQHTFGAVGFAEVHEAPRHFRRVHADVSRLGGVGKAREELAARLFGSAMTCLPDLDLGGPANAFRREVREWLADRWDAGRRETHRGLPFELRGQDHNFSRALATKGWIAVSWTTAFGGQGRSKLEQYAFVEEMSYAGAPTSAHTCGAELVGPALIRFGTTEQRAEFLPAILSGERSFCLGYSEAGSGSDLASLRTSARRDGDDWIVNGEKLWTTMAEHADYHWLAVRTDPKVAPHAGISIFMAPLDSPGITITPGMALYGHTFCSVNYDNVRIADSLRVGDVNGGWKVITHALAAERILMGAMVAAVRRLFDDLVRYLGTTPVDGPRLSDDRVVRDRIAELAAQVEAARQLVVNGVRRAELERTPLVEAALGKIASGEVMQRVCEAAIDLLGAGATLSEDSPEAPLDGAIEQTLRRSIMMVVGGGTPQIQRTVIGTRGLGLPR